VNEEQERVALELRRIREQARDSAAGARVPEQVLPAARPAAVRGVSARADEPAPPAPLARPDAAAVNQLWPIARAGGGPIGRFLARALRALLAAQEAFNAKQVQFDNEVLDYIDARIDATHRHYDSVLGVHGRHMQEIDERHLTLQEDLVAHVHDLVKRIDLVFAEAERGRLSLEVSLKDLRRRLVALEERLGKE
jgi:hypothetical protein